MSLWLKFFGQVEFQTCSLVPGVCSGDGEIMKNWMTNIHEWTQHLMTYVFSSNLI